MTVSEQVARAGRQRRRILAALVVLGWGLRLSCWPLGRRIPFESVCRGGQVREEDCELFLPVKYRIVVGSTPEEVAEIARCIGAAYCEAPPFDQIDLSKQFVVVAMARWISFGKSPPAEILRVCQKGNRVLVTARLAPLRFRWPLRMGGG